MMRLSQAAVALGATAKGADAEFDSVGTDSRAVKKGELFVALKGDRFDGHRFLRDAHAAGAAAAMIDATGESQVPEQFPCLVVNDTRAGLTQLARAWRNRYSMPLVALTGSSGKTTVKEMLAAILREAVSGADDSVLATRGNLNNDIGVPLTLLELKPTHRYAVIELGMNHAGEIRALTQLARPDVALINNAGRAHIEFLGSEEAIARAKGEIFEGLQPGGIGILNADDKHFALWQKIINKNKYLSFGLERPADVTARYTLNALDSEIHLKTPAGEIATTTHAPGLHNVRNAMAAAAAAVALEVPLKKIAAGLAHYRGIKGRLQHKCGFAGSKLIDDTYNANPESMRAAIDVLARMPGERLLVLGDMGELGDAAADYHKEIGRYARKAGLNRLFALGDLSAHAVAGFGAGAKHFASIESLLTEIESVLAPGVTVLVKGSRFMKMERVIAAFTEKEKECA